MRDDYHDPGAISNLATAALAYAARGWHVFPCDPQTKQPLTTHGFYDATTDAAQIEAWWQQWPCALIGIRTGPESGLFVLDVDICTDKGIDGSIAIAALERQYGALPDTLTSTTPRGGFHLFFEWHPGIRNNADSKLGAHLDVRGEGGYVIVPPSMRWDRKCYGWRENCSAEPAEAPTWLIELLTAPAAAPMPATTTAATAMRIPPSPARSTPLPAHKSGNAITSSIVPALICISLSPLARYPKPKCKTAFSTPL
jgi:hypothetical protein